MSHIEKYIVEPVEYIIKKGEQYYLTDKDNKSFSKISKFTRKPPITKQLNSLLKKYSLTDEDRVNIIMSEKEFKKMEGGSSPIKVIRFDGGHWGNWNKSTIKQTGGNWGKTPSSNKLIGGGGWGLTPPKKWIIF